MWQGQKRWRCCTIFVLGNMNINILQNDLNFLEKNVNKPKGKIVISSDAKNHIGFCSTLGWKQLIKVPTRITSNTSILIDHILTCSSEKIVQAGITETSLSDHQLIFCTSKIKRTKPNKDSYLTFCSMKNFSTEIYEEALGKLSFPDLFQIKLQFYYIMIFNQIKQIKNLGLGPFLKRVLCFYFYVFLFFWVSYVHLLLFVITFVFLYISADLIIDFNLYPRIN